MKTKKNHMQWAWSLMVLFLVLGILDSRFGILGFLCMIAPMSHALLGRGKIHCRSYCPRGSLLGKWLPPLSLNRDLPKVMTTKWFKLALLALMIGVFSYSLYHANWEFHKIAFRVFRFMAMSLGVGIALGIFFKPRSWCVVCPMGTATGMIASRVSQIK